MKNNKSLPEIEKMYVSMRNGLILKIKDIVSSQPHQTIHISGNEVSEPTWVFYGTDADEIEDCSVESVFIDATGDLSFTITASYGGIDVSLSETPYFFDSLKWLVNICYNICEALDLEPEELMIAE